ncbi:MAG: hypothetical protein FWD23_06530 [Oscillospiraceae bacterium]|nr:hypothetical protein [Oscillospiraceae bacterium]
MSYNFKSAGELNPIDKLPEILLDCEGKKIADAKEWSKHAKYLKEMLKYYMYGEVFDNSRNFRVSGEVLFSEEVHGRQAIHEFVKVTFGENDKRLSLFAEITRPNKPGRFRVITYIAFPNARDYEIEHEAVVKRNYAIALFNYEQLAPDKSGADLKSLPLCEMLGEDLDLKAVGLWAFCNMRLIDYLEETEYSLKDNYIVTGHSRNGKAALCAGIFDERVKVTVPNNSGCGGCGCFRYLGPRGQITQNTEKVESLERITKTFPHWFSENLNQFYDSDKNYSESSALNNKLPFDLHFNKALVAPRALLSLEAYGDEWANPEGSKITHDAARPVFDFLGVPENIDIRFREGGHDFGMRDWLELLDFCDKV